MVADEHRPAAQRHVVAPEDVQAVEGVRQDSEQEARQDRRPQPGEGEQSRGQQEGGVDGQRVGHERTLRRGRGGALSPH